MEDGNHGGVWHTCVFGAQHLRSIDALKTAIDFIIILLKKVAWLRTRAQSTVERNEFANVDTFKHTHTHIMLRVDR